VASVGSPLTLTGHARDNGCRAIRRGDSLDAGLLFGLAKAGKEAVAALHQNLGSFIFDVQRPHLGGEPCRRCSVERDLERLGHFPAPPLALVEAIT
jgi:hypothetical protein